jgi:hypothetical protein
MKQVKLSTEQFAVALGLAQGVVRGEELTPFFITSPCTLPPDDDYEYCGQTYLRRYTRNRAWYERSRIVPPVKVDQTLPLLCQVDTPRGPRWQRAGQAELALVVQGVELRRQSALPGTWTEAEGQVYVWVITGLVRFVTVPKAVQRRLNALARKQRVLDHQRQRIDQLRAQDSGWLRLYASP